MTRSLFIASDDATATISPCGLYRYDLTRTWGEGGRYVLFVMLNPSTADAEKPDPTMTRCLNYAKAWGFDGLAIVNLFAYRSPDPAALATAVDPVGPANDGYIRHWAARAGVVVAAWGADPFATGRAREVLVMVREVGKMPHCLKRSKDGHPCHPLYLKRDLTPFPMTETASAMAEERGNS